VLSSRMSFAQISLARERGSDLREPLRSPRLCVVLERAVTLVAPFADAPAAPTRRGDQRRPHLRPLLQVRELPRSVDYGRLMWHLTPFRINTSSKSRHSRIALIANDFKPTRLNTSAIVPPKPPRINTSKKQGRGGYR